MTLAILSEDIAFMEAVRWSEEQLARLADGWEPPCNSKDLEKVRDDAFRAMAKFPNEYKFALELAPELACEVVEAVHGRHGGLWVPDGPLVPYLRSLGLIPVTDRQLTCFGLAVRRALLKEQEAPRPATRPIPARPRSASEIGGMGRYRRDFSKPGSESSNPVHMPADIRRVEQSAPCGKCGCRHDKCACARPHRMVQA